MMADQKAVLRLLKTARGQIDGIIKMVEDDRYCMDISQQVTAADAMLRRANREILTAHLALRGKCAGRKGTGGKDRRIGKCIGKNTIAVFSMR